MQAILTKTIQATQTKPTRIKAECGRGSIIISWPDKKSEEQCHITAALALITKFVEEDTSRHGAEYENPWQKPFVSGCLKSLDWAHVYIS